MLLNSFSPGDRGRRGGRLSHRGVANHREKEQSEVHRAESSRRVTAYATGGGVHVARKTTGKLRAKF